MVYFQVCLWDHWWVALLVVIVKTNIHVENHLPREMLVHVMWVVCDGVSQAIIKSDQIGWCRVLISALTLI